MMHGFENRRRHDHDHDHEHEHSERFRKVCQVDTGEDLTITVPVEVKAHVDIRDVKIKCNGHEIIRESHCRPNVKKFKILQKVHICIPIDFVTECEIGEGDVELDLDII